MARRAVSLAILLRRSDPQALFERCAALFAGLPMTDAPPILASATMAHGTTSDAEQAAALAGAGHGRLAGAEGSWCEPMRQAIDVLLAEGLPAVFVYLADPIWALGERVRQRVSTVTGRPYVLVADAWAWRIDRSARGWPPHRGWARSVLDRASPELVNAWVALSDVEVDRSCMHVVPLDADPDYPAQLDRAPASSAALALPASAGDALFWNANTLHWGGSCAPSARGPRFSCSFSLVREDANGFALERLHLSRGLDRSARLELIADQIATYGENKPDVSPDVLTWARAAVALRRAPSL
jgi:hypothetical protein